MNKLQYHMQLPTRIIIGLLVVFLLIMLAFGLTPKNLSSDNHVSRVTGSSGIAFGDRGIAYTRPLLETATDKLSPENEFSVEISLKPKAQEEGGFRFIMALHNGKDRDQLLMGQWKSHIIVMNGDDYSYKRKIKRISVDTAALPSEELFITVTTGKSGTKIYSNGELLREKRDLKLTIPDKQRAARLILGNSVYGNNAWEGVIHGLALYPYALTALQISRHHDQWAKDRNFSFALEANPYLLYLFDEHDALSALDHGRRNNHIHMPAKMKTLERKFLSLPKGAGLSGGPVRDILLNLVGFIPFGFVLSAALIRLGHIHGKGCLVVTIMLGFILSLTIESCQAWIPTRYSSILDLILNTVGTMVGAVLYQSFFMRRIEDPTNRPVL